MIEQEYNTEQNILFVKLTGRVDFENMKAYFLSLKNYSDHTTNLFVLEDSRGISTKFTTEHLSQLSKTLNKVSKHYIEVNHAVVLEKSKDIALAMIINESLDENYVINVFTDKELALDWLK